MSQLDGNSEDEFVVSDDSDESDDSDDGDCDDSDYEILEDIEKNVAEKNVADISEKQSESDEFLSCNTVPNVTSDIRGTNTIVFVENFELDIASAPNDQVKNN